MSKNLIVLNLSVKYQYEPMMYFIWKKKNSNTGHRKGLETMTYPVVMGLVFFPRVVYEYHSKEVGYFRERSDSRFGQEM